MGQPPLGDLAIVQKLHLLEFKGVGESLISRKENGGFCEGSVLGQDYVQPQHPA
jgi:hypothetical protein